MSAPDPLVTPVDLVRAHPLVTNPHIRMCAVITEVLGRFGAEGATVLREAYTDLGHRTGEFMVASSVVPAGADLETYGRVSEQIMDACGLGGWTRLPTGDDQHATSVPGCAAYVDVYRRIGAPASLCAIPFAWDNGCLDVINPTLRISPERCVHAGDAECHYVIRRSGLAVTEPRSLAESGHVEGPGASTAPVAVAEAPAWTNPLAGLLAICSRSLERLPSARQPLEEALAALGRITGGYLLDHGLVQPGATPAEVAHLAAGVATVSGFGSVTVETTGPDAVLRHDDPFVPVLAAFGPAEEVRALAATWDDAWVAAIAPDVQVTAAQDADGTSSRRVFSLRPRATTPTT